MRRQLHCFGEANTADKRRARRFAGLTSDVQQRRLRRYENCIKLRRKQTSVAATGHRQIELQQPLICVVLLKLRVGQCCTSRCRRHDAGLLHAVKKLLNSLRDPKT